MKRMMLALCAVAFIMTVAAALSAQTAVAPNGVPALSFSHAGRSGARAWMLEYITLSDLNEPAFRIRAHHYHGWCNGYLYITPTRVAYDPVFTPGQKDGFSLRRADIVSARPRFAGYEFATADKLFRFAFLSDRTGAAASDQREALLQFVNGALRDFAAAQRGFVTALAGLPDASPPAKPLIRVLEPRGVQPGASADASGPVQSIVGVVSVAGGVRAAAVNDRPATLTPLAPDIALFQSPAFELPAGATPVKITVTASNDSSGELAFNATRPDITLSAPGTKVRDAAVTLRGSVVGLPDVERLNVAGRPVPLQRRADGGFDFVVPNVPVELGANAITGYAVQTDGRRQVFETVVTRIPALKPLTLDQLESGLRSGVSPSVMLGLVQSRGVAFELTPQIEKRLRALGATDDLLDAINEAYQ